LSHASFVLLPLRYDTLLLFRHYAALLFAFPLLSIIIRYFRAAAAITFIFHTAMPLLMPRAVVLGRPPFTTLSSSFSMSMNAWYGHE